MDKISDIILYILTSFWIISMYEIGKNHLDSSIIKGWKSISLFITLLAIYFYIILFPHEPDTGYTPSFNLDFFLKLFTPTIIPILIGLHFSKKK